MFDFTQVKEVKLSRASHKTPEQGMCFMEMAAWFAGEKHSDKPKCVSRILGEMGIMLNDRMDGRQRDVTLKPMIPHVVGTFDKKAESARMEYTAVRAFNYAVHLIDAEFIIRRRPARDVHDIFGMGYELTRKGFRPGGGRARDELGRIFFHFIQGELSAAVHVFALTGEIIPDWSVAIDTLREAIKLGRHEGFDVSVDLAARHADLVKLPKVKPTVGRGLDVSLEFV